MRTFSVAQIIIDRELSARIFEQPEKVKIASAQTIPLLSRIRKSITQSLFEID